MRENSPEETPTVETFAHKLWRWFIAPSPQIQERDQQRQATLLSALLLAIILLALIVEAITVAMIKIENYTGYRQTLASVCVMSLIYILSRTRHVRITGVLTVIAVSAAIFIVALAEPSGILGGLLDYLIISIWFGSLFLKPWELVLLMAVDLIGLLLVPQIAPSIALSDILIGPFSFIAVTSILVIMITQHRNLLEEDRRSELAEKEERSRHEAARAEALLRVAGSLNSQLDLDTLLITINEEVSRALNAPISLITLYNPKKDSLYSAAGLGVPPNLTGNLPRFSKEIYEQAARELGTVFAISDLQKDRTQGYIDQFKILNWRSLAFATMTYEHKLIGGLCVITSNNVRKFTKDELRLLQGLADQAALAIVNTRLYKDANRRLKNLQALRAIDLAIISKHDLKETLHLLLGQITRRLHVDAAAVLLMDKEQQQLQFSTSRGFKNSTARYTSLHIGEGWAGRAAQERQTIHIRDIRPDLHTLTNAVQLSREDFVSYYAVPLINQEQVLGVLEIFHRSLLNPDEEWFDFLESLAGQMAIAIQSTTLVEDLRHTNDELSQAYDSTIEGWSHAMDLRDKETEGHTLRVAELTLKLARAFGFNDAELIPVRRGALLHDIGKMGIPDNILLKEGALTPEEWDVMRQHPVYAYDMLLPIDYLRPSLDIPYAHHERWDGTGYPRGLKGEEIPLIARIFAVVDVWDALTSDRPYRAAWTHEKTLAHIHDGAGKHFDPHVVEVFENFMKQNSITENK